MSNQVIITIDLDDDCTSSQASSIGAESIEGVEDSYHGDHVMSVGYEVVMDG